MTDTPTISDATFKRLWQQGKTVDEMAVLSNRAKSTVWRRAKRLGTSRGHRRWSAEDIAWVVCQRHEGKSFEQIARASGLTKGIVAGVCYRHLQAYLDRRAKYPIGK